MSFNSHSRSTLAGLAFLLMLSVATPAAAQIPSPAPQPVVDVLGVPVQKLNLVESIISAANSAADHTLEYVLNGLAWDVANLAIESMTKSIVNWINSGFEGSPAFVTDLEYNLRGLSDAVADRFFDELAVSTQAIFEANGQDKVLDAVRLAYYLRTSPESFYVRYPNTLGQVSSDHRAFLDGDFSQGGWNAWISASLNLTNNPYGQRALLEDELSGLLASATGNRLQELSWGSGFRSLRACDTEGTGPAIASSTEISLSGVEPCAFGEMRTPGSVIQRQLNDALGSGRERLIVADDFNEIVGALLNQLVGHVLGANNSGGLSGVSRPSAGGGASFLDRSTDPSQGTGSGVRTAASFTATIEDQRRIVKVFQANWEKIRTAADSAAATCPNNSDAKNVVTRAQAALIKAADALAKFDDLLARIAAANAAGGNQSVAISGIANDFTILSRSSIVPTGEEIAEAKIESQDTGDLEPGSLYSQMVRAAKATSCQASGE
jgi:hypothetical protein